MSSPPAKSGGLSPETEARLRRLVEALVEHPYAPTAISTAEDAWERHVADSLSGLEVAELAEAQLVGDLGAGAGFPGLVLAVVLPEATVELIEGSKRKSAVALELAEAAGITNVAPVAERSEEWAASEGRERYEVVMARAVGSLAELCELASPLLRHGGLLVAWKGAREPAEERAAAAGASSTAMVLDRVISVAPFAASRDRHLHVYRKAGATPAGLPRRPGQAHKRPLGS